MANGSSVHKMGTSNWDSRERKKGQPMRLPRSGLLETPSFTAFRLNAPAYVRTCQPGRRSGLRWRGYFNQGGPPNAQKLLRLPSPTETASMQGASGMETSMDRFVRRQNVERYCKLLERVTEDADRQRIINLLAEEQRKQKVADDPV